jgi:hypothetical protein
MEENTKNHKELYWFGKKVCHAFEGMGGHMTPHIPRIPLLKDADFLSGGLKH